jgi:hypothetical protein
MTLFTICDHCLSKNSKTIKLTKKIYYRENFLHYGRINFSSIYILTNLDLPYIHEILSKVVYVNYPNFFELENEAEIVVKNYSFEIIDKFYFSNSDDGYYLIKWADDSSDIKYTYELSKFIDSYLETLPEDKRNKIFQTFLKRMKKEEEIYKKYFDKEEASRLFQGLLGFKYPDIIPDLCDLNVLYLADSDEIENQRREILNKIVLKLLGESKNSKILICYDSDAVKDIYLKSLAHDGLIILDFRPEYCEEQIYSEIYYHNIKKIRTLSDRIFIDSRLIKPNVILININAFNIAKHEFKRIEFDFSLFDLSPNTQFSNVKDYLSDIVLQTKTLILKSVDQTYDLNYNFVNFLTCFYKQTDKLIEVNSGLNLHLLDSDKKLLPNKFEDMLMYVRLQFKWSVIDKSVDLKNPYYVKNAYFQTLKRGTEMLQIDRPPRLVINLLPITVTETIYNYYIKIIRSRREILENQNQNKSDTLRNLVAFCSFPANMAMFYQKAIDLDDKHIINTDKYRALVDLLKTFKLNKVNKTFINIIYADEANNGEDNINILINRLSDEKDLSGIKELIRFIDLDHIATDDFQNLDSGIFIFLNVFLKNDVKSLFKAIFDIASYSRVLIYHLFLEYTVEQNLLEEFYPNLFAFIEKDVNELSLIKKIYKEGRMEYFLKKNLINLNPCSDDTKIPLTHDDMIINALDKENNPIDIKEVDGLIFNDGRNKVFFKNIESLDFNYVYKLNNHTWDELLTRKIDVSNESTRKRRRVASKSIEKFKNNNVNNISCFSNNILPQLKNRRNKMLIEDDSDEEIFELVNNSTDIITNLVQSNNINNNSNFSICKNGSFCYSAKKDLKNYFLSLNKSDLNPFDIIWNIGHIFINHGFTKRVRLNISSHIEKYGINLEDFENYADDIFRRFNLLSEINTENLRFYLEYFLFILNEIKTAEDENLYQLTFYTETNKSQLLKKRILNMSKLRFLLKNLNTKENIRFLMNQVKGNISQIGGVKLAGDVDLNILVNLGFNTLRGIDLFGYGKNIFNFRCLCRCY